MGKRCLVTGGAGFIGSHIARRLVREGATVRVVDNLSTGQEARLSDIRDSIEFINVDLAYDQVTDRVTSDVDYVLHQAAVPSVHRSVSDPVGTHRANVTATLNLLESSRKAGVRRFVYAASSSAYGDTAVLPKTEKMPPNPLAPYALQKLIGEYYCKLYYDLYGLETVSLRYFNVFGPGQDPRSEYSAVIPRFISRLLDNHPLIVYGDGEQSRDFTYVDNVVEANLAALRAEAAPGKIVNVGYGERTSLNTLIQILEGIIGVKAEVQYEAARAGDVRHSLADLSRARDILGYRPTVDLEAGLRRTVDAMRQRGRSTTE